MKTSRTLITASLVCAIAGVPAYSVPLPPPEVVAAEADLEEVEASLSFTERRQLDHDNGLSDRYRYVHLDHDVLAKAGGWPRTVTMTPFPDVSFTISIDQDSERLLVGYVIGLQGSRVSAVRARGRLDIGIRAPGIGNFRIKPTRRRAFDGDTVHMVLEIGELDFSADEIGATSWFPVLVERAKSSAGGLPINILVLPTVEVLDSWGQGNEEFFAQEILYTIQEVFDIVALPMFVELAGAPGLPINDFYGSDCISLGINLQNDVYVTSAREGTAADIVIVVANVNGPALGCAEGNTSPVGDASNFLAIVDPTVAMSTLAPPHEVGHVFGAGHEDTGQSVGPFSNAYSPPGSSDATVMWSNTSRTHHPVYSDPLIFYGPLQPAGVETTKNWEVMRDLGFYVTNYRTFAEEDIHGVAVDGPGQVVSDGPFGFDCPPVCEIFTPLGLPIVVEAIPHAGSEFVEWSGDCFVDPFGDPNVATTYNLLFDDPVNYCTASFIDPTGNFRLTVAKTGTGEGLVTSDPGGVHCNESCESDSGFFPADENVELSAATQEGFRFNSWGGDCTGGTSPITVTMDSDLDCTADFGLGDDPPADVVLTLGKMGDGSGTARTLDGEIFCGPSCSSASADYPNPSTVTVRADEEPGSVFVGWGASCVGGPDDQEMTITLIDDRHCDAHFELETGGVDKTLVVTVNAAEPEGSPSVEIDPGGFICPSNCVHDFPEDSQVTLTATEDGDNLFKFHRCTLEDGSILFSQSPQYSFDLDQDADCVSSFFCGPADDCGPDIPPE